MRPAPPIVWSCSGSAVWRWLRIGLAALAASSFGAWLLGHIGLSPVGVALVALCAALVATICAVRWVKDTRGTLSWTGQAWTWQAEGASAADAVLPAIALDVQRAMLLSLSLRPAGHPGFRSRPVWLVVSRAQDPARWSQLCTTLLNARGTEPEA